MNGQIQDFLVNIMLLSAAGTIAFRMPKRRFFLLRAVLCLIGVSLIRYLYFYGVYPSTQGEMRDAFYMLGYVLLLLLAMGSVLICFRCDLWAALFCSGTGYCVQHVCQRSCTILRRSLPDGAPEWAHILCFLAVMAVGLALMRYMLRQQHIENIVVDNKAQLLAALAVIAVTTVLDQLFAMCMRQGDLQGVRDLETVTIILCCIMLFLLQLGMLSNKSKDLELSTIKALMKANREQYFFEKELIDTINIKCHDLKHQIARLDGQAQKDLQEELYEAVNAYDSTYRTGNTALDVILTRAGFACRSKEIGLTCIANGLCLEFMSEADIYSLFGNILDNAIEASEKVPDKEKRIVSLSIAQEGYFINIHTENYFADKLTFSNGLPKTTKGDTAYHGFGVKSIEMLVHKYGGSLKLFTKEERFILDIMFSV